MKAHIRYVRDYLDKSAKISTFYVKTIPYPTIPLIFNNCHSDFSLDELVIKVINLDTDTCTHTHPDTRTLYLLQKYKPCDVY